MKKILLWLFITASFQLTTLQLFSQSVAINNDGSDPHPSSILDIKSNTKGLLIPRMTTAERDLITDPAKGLLVFDDDENTFYFHNGGGWIALSTGSSTNFWSLNGANIFNNNAGYVGIGTDIPATALHIKKDDEALRLEGVMPYLSFYNNAGVYKGFVWQGPGDNISMGTGIGNTAGRVEIYNNGTLNMAVNSSGVMDLNGSSPWLRLNDGSNRSGDIYGDGSNLEIAAYKSSIFGVPGNLILQAGEIGPFQSLYAGYVGIGTRTPVHKLTVETGTTDYGILHTDGTISIGTWVGNAGGYLGTKSNHPLRFFTANGPTQMTILTNGNVGIGTTAPTYKLSVNGNIRSKEVVVETGWADYVFEKNYALPTLNDLEKFIQQNKHLPNIPSAKEVEEKGLNLGDMQKRMMEKIEELTLYVIELKKEIEHLKKK